jgi:hypothetical protein
MEDLLKIVPRGWIFYTACGPEASGRGYSVMFRVDENRLKSWHAMGDEEREQTEIYVISNGKTLFEALNGCAEKAQRAWKIEQEGKD